MKIAVIGAGWSGLAAAVTAVERGHKVKVFEAANIAGGRARRLEIDIPAAGKTMVDNGQHILIGAYTETLNLMKKVGVNGESAFLRLPLDLRFADGSGLSLPDLPAPIDALAGILLARGWSLQDKLSLLKTTFQWKRANFQCNKDHSVADICSNLSRTIFLTLIEPLCIAALNTSASEASAEVFLRVLKDALLGSPGCSNLLLPRVDLTSLFPEPAAQWIRNQGSEISYGTRVNLIKIDETHQQSWFINNENFDAVILATSASAAAALLTESAGMADLKISEDMLAWCQSARQLDFRSIATVYAWQADASLKQAMIALPSDKENFPVQFVFDRGQLGGPRGLIALVASVAEGERDFIQSSAVKQAKEQLGLDLSPLQTVMEKRATFACTPGIQRPNMPVSDGLVCCGDYVQGPYPATLEGAVRTGIEAVTLIENAKTKKET